MASTEVKKLIPVTVDLGNVALFDINPFDDARMTATREQREEYLAELARDNAQLLFNGLHALPTESEGDFGRLVRLPKATTVIPREKPVPVDKAPTRWDLFAKAKGITREKRSKKVYDEARGEWLYRYGSRSAKNDSLADWCEEIKD